MSLLPALVAGGALGVRHALEADHLAAVATLVDRDRTGLRSGLVGASWGIGHSLPIIALGTLFLLAGIRPPEVVTALFEIAVGVILVYLGARLLADSFDVARHAHGGVLHSHLPLGPLSLGATHAHLDGDSFCVGLVHGFAGSGALVVLLVPTAPTLDAALAFLLAFSFLSVATMAVASTVWARTLGTGLATSLERAAALVSILTGVLLLAEQLLGVGVF